MKIICAKIVDGEPQIYTKSDIAVMRSGEDIYYPLFASNLCYEFAFAVKICRVGKSIRREFADRYRKEAGVVVNLWSEGVKRELMDRNAPIELSYNFDNSFISPESFWAIEPETEVVVKCSNEETILWSDVKDKLDDMIAYISQYMTLKCGDIIMLSTSKEVTDAQINERIFASINNEIILQTTIK